MNGCHKLITEGQPMVGEGVEYLNPPLNFLRTAEQLFLQKIFFILHFLCKVVRFLSCSFFVT